MFNDMDWPNLLISLLGGGAVASALSIYNAKSNKDTIDIGNFHSLIEEERAERESIKQEYREYQKAVDRKVEQVKREMTEMRLENQKMIASIYQAYRCKYPEQSRDCPVIQMFTSNCNDCDNKNGCT